MLSVEGSHSFYTVESTKFASLRARVAADKES